MTELYRGSDLPAESLEFLKTTGNKFLNPAFMSFSKKKAVAFEGVFQGNVQITLMVDESEGTTYALDVREYSIIPEEEEILFYPYSGFEVMSHEMEGTILKVTLRPFDTLLIEPDQPNKAPKLEIGKIPSDQVRFRLKNSEHGDAYLGMWGHIPSLGVDNEGGLISAGGQYGVFGFWKETGRSHWQVEKADGDMYYLKNVAHESYLGMCGSKMGVNGDREGLVKKGGTHGVFGFSRRDSPCRWKFEWHRDGWVLKNVDSTGGPCLGMWGWIEQLNVTADKGGLQSMHGRYGVFGFSEPTARCKWKIEPIAC